MNDLKFQHCTFAFQYFLVFDRSRAEIGPFFKGRENPLGKSVSQPLENQPIFGFLFSGGAVPGSGGEKTLLP